MKTCTKCNELKELTQFTADKMRPTGYRPYCKKCKYKMDRARKHEPNPSIIEHKCYICCITKPINEFNINRKNVIGYNHYCKLCRKAITKKHYEKIKHTEKYKKRHSSYRKSEEGKAKLRLKEKINVMFRLSKRLRCRLYQSLKSKRWNKNNNLHNYLGCSLEELKLYIEKQFQPGMTWENHSYNGWHIDHIIPLASAKSEEEMYKLCHYTNLQPLWKEDNMKKSG
jgi:hypothetical protein